MIAGRNMIAVRPDEPRVDPATDSVAAFHAHLDACPQCRTMPFNLCAIGGPLLALAALALAASADPETSHVAS